MPSAALEALYANLPNGFRDVVLVEIEARVPLRGTWTSAGSGAYSMAFSAFTHPASLRADRGIYREVTGVKENRTALTSRASLASVQANPGSYFYDEANETLYVETAGSVSPSTIALMQVVCLLRFSTQTIGFAGEPPYRCLLDGSSLPTLRAARADLLRGVSIFPSGDLTMVNTDGLWDLLVKQDAYLWANNTVTFRYGGGDIDLADYDTFTMQVAKVAAGHQLATIQLRSRSNATTHAFPERTYYDHNLPSTMLNDNRTKLQPMFWGIVTGVPVLTVHDTNDKLLVLDPGARPRTFLSPYFKVTAVAQVTKADGTVAAWPGWSEGVGEGQIDLTAGPFSGMEDYDWFVDVYRTTGTGSTTASLYRCGEIARNILEACGVPTAQIDTTAFSVADAANPAPLGLWVGDVGGVSSLVQAVELLNQIERSTLSSIHIGADGRWTMTVWDPSFDVDDLPVLTEADIYRWEPITQVDERPVANIKVRYNYNYRTQTWQETSSTSTGSEAELDAAETEIVETCLVYEADAEKLAARLQLIASRATERYRADVGPTLMAYSVGDKVRVSLTRGPSFTTSFDGVFEIESNTRLISNQSVEVILGNQRSVGERIKRVAANGTSAYSSATASERKNYAFAADSTTEVTDTSDAAATYRHAVVY